MLFTTQDISLRQANAILAEAGFRGVMRLDEVVRLDAIPVLGTGKTDYKVLRKMVAERSNAGVAISGAAINKHAIQPSFSPEPTATGFRGRRRRWLRAKRQRCCAGRVLPFLRRSRTLNGR